MNKNLWGLAAFALAIAFTSFTVFGNKPMIEKGKFISRYASYIPPISGVDPQTDPGNYSVQSLPPATCDDEDRLCWIKFEDTNNNGILDEEELAAYFATHDLTSDNSLDDETEIPGVLEKKM